MERVMSIKAYSYTRYSSKAQRDGDSLRRQLKAAMDWAEERPDIELDTTMRDLGVSAFKGEHRVKGALASFLKRVENGEIARNSYLLVESFDRLSRETETIAINLLTGLTLAGIKVVTLVDQHVYDDKSDAMDLFRAIIVMSRAHEEQKTKGKRLKSSWASKKDKARLTGEILTRRGPAWTQYDEETKRFIVPLDREEIIHRIFRDYLAGMGGAKIAETFNAEGIEPFVKSSRGWHAGYILTILTSRSVMGYYQPTFWSKTAGEKATRQHDGEDIAGYYPAIINEATFNRAQALLATNRKHGRQGRGKHKSHANVLLGLARCEACGGGLILGNIQNKARSRYYRCYDSARQHSCTNKTRYYLTEVLEALEYAIIQTYTDVNEPTDIMRDVTVQEGRLQTLARKVEFLLDQLEEGIPGVAERLRERQAEMKAVEKKIVALKSIASTEKAGDRTNMAIEAIRFLQSLDTLNGDDLYKARARLNAMLLGVFEWVMPTASGVYAGQRDRLIYAERDLEMRPINLPADTPIVGKALNALRGPIPDFAVAA